MATYEKTSTGYTITHAGQTVTLPTEHAYELYAWLHTYADEMWNEIHPPIDIATVMLEFMKTPGRAWYPEEEREPQEE